MNWRMLRLRFADIIIFSWHFQHVRRLERSAEIHVSVRQTVPWVLASLTSPTSFASNLGKVLIAFPPLVPKRRAFLFAGYWLALGVKLKQCWRFYTWKNWPFSPLLPTKKKLRFPSGLLKNCEKEQNCVKVPLGHGRREVCRLMVPSDVEPLGCMLYKAPKNIIKTLIADVSSCSQGETHQEIAELHANNNYISILLILHQWTPK